MISFVLLIEYLGTIAFAISGMRLSSEKNFDIFGAYVIGFATACGGGTIRDLLLNATPFWMTSPSYLICTAIALFLVVILKRFSLEYHGPFFIFDSIGLALFTVVGIEKALSLGQPFWVSLLMGCVTGAAGGVLRDVLINEEPLIFRKEIYASACIIGGIVFWFCRHFGAPDTVVEVISGFSVFITRVLAEKYHFSLPRI